MRVTKWHCLVHGDQESYMIRRTDQQPLCPRCREPVCKVWSDPRPDRGLKSNSGFDPREAKPL